MTDAMFGFSEYGWVRPAVEGARLQQRPPEPRQPKSWGLWEPAEADRTTEATRPTTHRKLDPPSRLWIQGTQNCNRSRSFI